VDNGDTLGDLADPDCAHDSDDDESGPLPQCSDGVDNDGDTLVDLADPDCADESDDDESAPPRECSDGVDNDGDGLVDWPADTECQSASDNNEATDPPHAACGLLGIEPLLLAVLIVRRRRARAA
jgi:hypothetical protein